MTIHDVDARIMKIREMADDQETAHKAENELHRDVLRAIAMGAQNAAHLAELALTTADIRFPRWYA